MRHAFLTGLLISVLAVPGYPSGIRLVDVPAHYWASSAVKQVVARHVMTVVNGRFYGNQKVTRSEFTIALVNFALSLQKSEWALHPQSYKAPRPILAKSLTMNKQPLTRYELAAIFARSGPFIQAGLPSNHSRHYGNSTALPAADSVKVPLHQPDSSALLFLTHHRMIWPGSPLIQLASQPITVQDASVGLAQMILGLNDEYTDEPENRPGFTGPSPNTRARLPGKQPPSEK